VKFHIRGSALSPELSPERQSDGMSKIKNGGLDRPHVTTA